jgi:hypothetical protein
MLFNLYFDFFILENKFNQLTQRYFFEKKIMTTAKQWVKWLGCTKP